MIIQERLEKLPAIVLAEGAHLNFNAGVCAMELASWLVGNEFTDHPECVCPVIGAFVRSWNDALPDDRRTALLLPLIPATIGTRGSAELANRRATMATDWLARVHTPAWLRLAGLTEHADALAGLREITDFANTLALMPALEAAKKDAAAAWDAAWDAAGDALASTVTELQASAVDLIERMCVLSEAARGDLT